MNTAIHWRVAHADPSHGEPTPTAAHRKREARTVSQKGLMVVEEDMLAANQRDGVVGKRSALPALWMALVVERACTEIWKAWEEKSDTTELRVHPAVYEAVALARSGEVSRGYPLMLLGLELIPDGAVQIYEPVVIRS